MKKIYNNPISWLFFKYIGILSQKEIVCKNNNKKTMSTQQDTIYALSSTPGRSAISVIRISGKETFRVINTITRGKISKPKHQTAYPCAIYNINNNLIDKVVTTVYCSPNSYTGENLAEITTHGNPIIVDRLFNTFRILGLRLANPGEFTSRAYHNKKIDLIQAESILSIINAKI